MRRVTLSMLCLLSSSPAFADAIDDRLKTAEEQVKIDKAAASLIKCWDVAISSAPKEQICLPAREVLDRTYRICDNQEGWLVVVLGGDIDDEEGLKRADLLRERHLDDLATKIAQAKSANGCLR
ncbi:hypothetical protein RHECIAT_CH0000856 [Rhizobium etli CIAT 652]|uniref:Uncharacterized protein n=1 Tax=Rhizobium etli (strain CIAT 652) TaxID=491916 RepID=B3PQJ7_RHIE6|nr:hypothetical protein RHECIAT_CH0000856 [Rhizobium etli CIAT 652]